MIKYWIRSEEYQDKLEEYKTKISQETQKVDLEDLPLPATRAFIHPSSVLFSTNSVNLEDAKLLSEVDGPISRQSKIPTVVKYPFVLFTTSQVTNKLYLRDLTPTYYIIITIIRRGQSLMTLEVLFIHRASLSTTGSQLEPGVRMVF